MNADLADHWHALTAPLLPDYGRRYSDLAKLLSAYGARERH